MRFTVTPTGASTFADGTTGAKELTTGADGTASLEGQLCVGATYDIAETAAPAGYELAGESLRVTVQADGSLAAADGVSAPWSLDGSAATVSLADEPIRAFVKKVNANDETQALSGVTFDVVGAFADGAASKSVETGADGTVLIEGLVAGNRYQVTETGVPAGYTRIAGTFAFDVRADGTLVPAGDMVGYRVDADGVTVVAADVPTRLVVEKVAEDGALLPGARFTVTPTGASTFADGTTGAKALTTGADGTASLEGQLCVGATYDIAETAAPAGYELIAGTLSIRVAEDGAIEATGVVPNGYEKGDANTFTVRAVNTPVVVGLQKVSTDDYATPLAGAEFVVTGAFADGSTEQCLTTDDGGLVNLEALLVAGETYTIVEVRAADGHEIAADPFSFVMAADGSMTAAAGSVEAGAEEPGYQIADGGVIALTMADAPIKAKIMKTNRDGEPLAGAVFEIVPHDGSDAKTFYERSRRHG